MKDTLTLHKIYSHMLHTYYDQTNLRYTINCLIVQANTNECCKKQPEVSKLQIFVVILRYNCTFSYKSPAFTLLELFSQLNSAQQEVIHILFKQTLSINF